MPGRNRLPHVDERSVAHGTSTEQVERPKTALGRMEYGSPDRGQVEASGALIEGKYRLLERIGTGGMGEVYRAENTLIGKIVALKLLLPDRIGDTSLAARLFAEAQAVSKIRHPGIADILDAGQSDLGPFLVLEYLDGQTAAESLRKGPLTVDCALSTVRRILDPLGAAHAAGIIHRDLKPENVFFALDGWDQLRVKLLDFGISKSVIQEATSHTSTGVVMGTPNYLSPEQAVGEFDLDQRSDLFSVGALLFELLSGMRPFRAATAVSTAYQVAHGDTPVLVHQGGPVDPRLQALIDRALRKEREERFQSADEFAVAIDCIGFRGDALQEVLGPTLRIRSRQGGGESGAGPTPPSWSIPTRETNSTPEPAVRNLERTGGFTATQQSVGHVDREAPASSPSSTEVTGTIAPASTSSRSLPKRFCDRFHVRGLVLIALDEHVKTTFAVQQRSRLFESLPREFVDNINANALQGIVHYPLETASTYLDVITRDLYGANPTWCRAAGDIAATGALAPAFRAAQKPAAIEKVLRRLLPSCRQLLDFGAWGASDNFDGPIEVTVGDFEPASLPLRLWLTGVVAGSLRAAGSHSQVKIIRGEAPFSPHMILQVGRP